MDKRSLDLKSILAFFIMMLGLGFSLGCGQNTSSQKLSLNDLGETDIQKILGPHSETPSALYKGKIALQEGVMAPPDAKLFVIVRQGSPKGPMIGGKLIDGPNFPLPFEIGTADMFAPLESLASDALFLAARLDQDGDPTTRQPGDLEAVSQEPIPMGQQDLELTLSAP